MKSQGEYNAEFNEMLAVAQTMMAVLRDREGNYRLGLILCNLIRRRFKRLLLKRGQYFQKHSNSRYK